MALRARTCEDPGTQHELHDQGSREALQQLYEVQSGRRAVAVREAPSAQIALLDHVRSMGCRDSEITRLSPESVAWRGAVFRAVRVPPAGAS